MNVVGRIVQGVSKGGRPFVGIALRESEEGITVGSGIQVMGGRVLFSHEHVVDADALRVVSPPETLAFSISDTAVAASGVAEEEAVCEGDDDATGTP